MKTPRAGMQSNGKRRVVHIAPTPFFSDRGCHIRIEGIVRCLDAMGWQSSVCTYHHGDEVPSVTTRRIGTIKRYSQTSAGPNPWKLWADCKLFWLGLKTVYSERPQLIHAHLHEGLVVAVAIKLALFWRWLPIIADLQGSFTGEMTSHGAFKRGGFIANTALVFEKLLMRTATHSICSSDRALSLFTDELGFPNTKIDLVQDGADPGPSISQAEQDTFRQRHNLPKQATLAVYSGALQRAKGLEALKSAIVTALTQSEVLYFVVVGYPTEALAGFLKDHNLEHRVALLGRVAFSELPHILGCCDLAIDPKNYAGAGEGSGKLLNYLANSLPVVAFDTPNNRAFLPKETPLADSTQALAEQIVEFAHNAKTRKIAGQRNRKHFDAHYGWTVAQSQLENAYGKL